LLTEPFWITATIDSAFLVVFAAVVWREVIAGKNARNLKVAAAVSILATANIVFNAVLATSGGMPRLAVHTGLAALLMLIVLIGGRITPAFTRNWLRQRGASADAVRSHGPIERLTLVSLSVRAGTEGPQTAFIEVDDAGEIRSAEIAGNGPVDAVFNAIRAVTQRGERLDHFQVHAVTGGTDAQAEVSVRLVLEGLKSSARASDPDTLVAAARAYLHALNRLDARAQKRVEA